MKPDRPKGIEAKGRSKERTAAFLGADKVLESGNPDELRDEMMSDAPMGFMMKGVNTHYYTQYEHTHTTRRCGSHRSALVRASVYVTVPPRRSR